MHEIFLLHIRAMILCRIHADPVREERAHEASEERTFMWFRVLYYVCFNLPVLGARSTWRKVAEQ